MYDMQKIISDLKQIAAECEKVTSDNVSHRIANIEHGILNIADYLENYCPLGWHPASELPPVNKDTGYSDVVCFYATARDGRKLFLFEGRYCKAYIGEKKAHNPFINDGWCYADGGKINEVLNVKWWCYPPKED